MHARNELHPQWARNPVGTENQSVFRSDAHGDGFFRSPFTRTQHGLGPERGVLYVLAARRQPRGQDQLAGKAQKTVAVAVVLPDNGLATGPRLDLGGGE